MVIAARINTIITVPVDLESAADTPTEPPAVAPRRRRRLRIAVIVLAALVLLAGGGVLAAALYARDINGDIARIEAFAQVPQQARPVKEKAAGDAMNFLILGSDTRDPETTGGSRTDTII